MHALKTWFGGFSATARRLALGREVRAPLAPWEGTSPFLTLLPDGCELGVPASHPFNSHGCNYSCKALPAGAILAAFQPQILYLPHRLLILWQPALQKGARPLPARLARLAREYGARPRESRAWAAGSDPSVGRQVAGSGERESLREHLREHRIAKDAVPERKCENFFEKNQLKDLLSCSAYTYQ